MKLHPTRIRGKKMNKKFNVLTFIEPFLSYIDSGKLFRKPFSWLYMALAGSSAVLPFCLLYRAINIGDIFDEGIIFTLAIVFAWLFVVVACWIGVQIWWNR